MADSNCCGGVINNNCPCTLRDILLKLPGYSGNGHPSGNYEIVSDGNGNYDIVISGGSGNPLAKMVMNPDGTYTFDNGVDSPVTISFTETLTTYVSDVINGNKIGTYTDELGNPTDITETITIMNQQANGDIEYLSEDAVVDTAVILSTDANQLLTSGTDKGNLLTAADLISTGPNNTIIVGPDGKLLSPVVSVFPDDQVFSGIATDTTSVTFTPLPPNPDGQVNYNLEVDVKTQCEIDSDGNGIKLADSFYENLNTSHLVNIANVQAFDPNGELLQANVVKDGCSLKVFINKPDTIFYKDHGVSDLSLVTDISVGGLAPDVVSLVVTNLTSNFNLSTWYSNILTSGKKVNQKLIISNYSGTLFDIEFNHAGLSQLKSISDGEILTVKALVPNILYED